MSKETVMEGRAGERPIEPQAFVMASSMGLSPARPGCTSATYRLERQSLIYRVVRICRRSHPFSM